MKPPRTTSRPGRRATCLCGVLGVSWFAVLAVQAADRIDTSELEERGAILETVGEGFFALSEARGVGDLDGDGLADIVLAAREGGFASQEPLAVVLVYGRPGLRDRHLLGADLEGSAVFRIQDPNRTQSGAVRIDSAGDLNGDGRGELLLSYSAYQQEPDTGLGTVFLLFGRSKLTGEGFVEEIGSEFLPGVVFRSSDPETGKHDQGHAAIGDVNGDERPDLAIGAYSSTLGNGLLGGMVFVLLDATDLPPSVDLMTIGDELPGFQIHGPAGEGLGRDIVAVGDFDGDGLDDFLIMARSERFSGKVYLVRGREEFPPVLDLQQVADNPEAQGVTVFRKPPGRLLFGGPGQGAGVGDVNGDGRADILLGASSSELPPPGETAPPSVVYLFYGRGDFPAEVDLSDVALGLGTRFFTMREGATTIDALGSGVASAGDANGDLVPDLLIGAETAGEAYLVFGKRDFGAELSLADDFDGIRILGESQTGGFGAMVSAVGQFDLEGGDDVLISAPNLGGPFTGKGRAYLVYGTGSGTPPFTVLSLEPNSGSVRGGTTVVIRGSGFDAGMSVRFGTRPSASLTVVSDVELRASTPPAAGPKVVDVVVSLGGDTRIRPSAFEYVPDLPEIDLDDLGGRGVRADGDASDPTRVMGSPLAWGDLTGDAVDDLLIGVNSETGWTISVLRGGVDLPASLPAFEASAHVSIVSSSALAGTFELTSIRALGDVNGDDRVDMGIATDGARGYLVFGAEDLPREIDLEELVLTQKAIRLDRGQAAGRFTFAPVGDSNSDGFDDFAVGTPGAPATAGGAGEGAGEIIFVAGREIWPTDFQLDEPANYLARIHGAEVDDGLADDLVAVGDVDGDGSRDLLVSASPSLDTARSYLLYMGQDLAPELDINTLVAQGGATVLDRVGRSAQTSIPVRIAPAGDVNRDGHADFLIGDEYAGDEEQGIAFLVLGGPELPATLRLEDTADDAADDPVIRIVGSAPRTHLSEVAPAGDYNGDGFDDFMVGEQNPSPLDPGHLSVILGGEDLPARIELGQLGRHGFRVQGRIPVTRLFTRAVETGDLNGDGRLDFAFSEVGSPGAVYAIYSIPDAVSFVRGDATFDGELNISDPIFILSFLFLGGTAPLCEDAADVDDDGVMSITDAIYGLTSLFLGGPAPPNPFPEPGPDTTDDPLGCRGF